MILVVKPFDLVLNQVTIHENCIEGFVMNGAWFYKHYFESESNPKGRIDCCKTSGYVVNSIVVTEIEYFVDNHGRGFNCNEILSEKYFKAKPIKFSKLINKLKEVEKPSKIKSVLDSAESLLYDDIPF